MSASCLFNTSACLIRLFIIKALSLTFTALATISLSTSRTSHRFPCCHTNTNNFNLVLYYSRNQYVHWQYLLDVSPLWTDGRRQSPQLLIQLAWSTYIKAKGLRSTWNIDRSWHLSVNYRTQACAAKSTILSNLNIMSFPNPVQRAKKIGLGLG